ncbi:type VI secretion system Vgr family protein [Achromobacter sp. MFA1 R4]|uniref:type VI secretion system Vgr family protein n=1 Tax=Achromobacter sp. MFA1 R4 TaxID=1881016 RepID=UPI00095382C6|nr:type VI secretion system Vgr family protein [Achromobacter sp. MFA1 R4]SIT16298.1 type VI secretion system secreted protein VgrG [Achromobacter sp. MFA1 R4]
MRNLRGTHAHHAPRSSDLRFTFSPSAAGVQFDVIEFMLDEALSETFLLRVALSSFDAAVDFGALLDQPALFTIWRGDAPVRHVHGIVTGFEQSDTGFRRTRYRAVVEPALARASLCSDWRIFQQQSVPEILGQIIKSHGITDYEQVTTHEHLPREYCVQAGDTDLRFLDRLAAEEGFFYRFEHTDKGHRLIHGDRIYVHGAIDGGPVIYNPTPGGDQPEPALRRFTYAEHVRTARQTQRDYTYTHPQYDQEHSALARELDHQDSRYERYDYPGRYKRDEAGKPFTHSRLLGLRRDARMAHVEGDDARLVPGVAFDLTGHPREDWNHGWRPVRMQHHGIQHTSQQEDGADAAQGTQYRYTADIVPDKVDWKPEPALKPRIDGPQIASVVGPANEEIYCDAYGRVKVQFPWDRLGRNDEHSSCWIRVSQNWAGAAWGHMAIPRIGQEVIVDFLDGDCDQPIITGRTYRATNLPPYALPRHNILNTVKTKEHKGSRANELRLDDTSGQISAALMSDHAATALNLGYLTHPRPSGGVPRGQGFELRTDAHGVLRAGGGMLLTTEMRANAGEHHKDLPETAERLSVAREQQDTFATLARDVMAQDPGDQDGVASALQAQHGQIQGQGPANPQANHYPELSAPHLVLASPAGIATSTPGCTHIASGEHIALSSTGHTSVSAGKRLLASASRGMRFFVQSLGYRLIAAAGDIDIKALKDSINVLAKLNVNVSATRITISAKEEIVINAGGSGTTYNAGGITHATGGAYKVHSAGARFTGPKSQAGTFPDEPKPSKGNLELYNIYANRKGFKAGEFRVEDALGKVYTGALDSQGFAAVSGAAPGPASVSFGKDPSDTWDMANYTPGKAWTGPAWTGAAPTAPAQIQSLATRILGAAQQALQTAQQASTAMQTLRDAPHRLIPLAAPSIKPPSDSTPGPGLANVLIKK